jgi:hemerythrin superfamily protein
MPSEPYQRMGNTMVSSISSKSKKSVETLTVKHDVIVLLKQDHAEVKKLFVQFKKLAEKEDVEGKAKVANKICAELTVHAAGEEKIFYPPAREATHDDALLNEAAVEHDSAKSLISQIQTTNPEDPMYDAKMQVLGEYINHHVEEEEAEMFPKVRASKELNLQELAVTFSSFKKKMMKQLSDSNGDINQQELQLMISSQAVN